MGRCKGFLGRNKFLKGLRVGYYENLFIGLSLKDFSYCGGSLDTKGRLVIASFYVFS